MESFMVSPQTGGQQGTDRFFAKPAGIGYLPTMSLIKGETGEWEIVLGLEVHAQVTSDAKLFSGAPTTFGADPNTQVSLVDAAMPGMLPELLLR
jgi:hypothetical protein